MRKEWNHSEIEILRRNYSFKSRADIKQLLPNRTASSINHQASRLKLPKSSWFWSDEELAVLRANWSDNGRPKLLSLLPLKDWTSIRHKAFDLKLKKQAHRQRYWHTYRDSPKVVLTDKQIGYFAGIIDGEGSISIKRAKENGAVYYAPCIGITNTDLGLMNKCKEIFKCGTIKLKTAKPHPNHKTCYVYIVGSVKGVKQILVQIVDELTCKKKQAELVLEFITAKEEKKGYGLEPREEGLFQQVRALNAHGKGAPKKRHVPVGDGNA